MNISSESVIVPLGTTKDVMVTVTSSVEDRFVLTVLGEKPWMVLSSQQVMTEAGVPAAARVYFTPRDPTMFGLYKVRLVAFSLTTGEKQEKDVYISVVRGDGVFAEKVVLTGDWYPTGTLDAAVHVKNYGTSQLQNLKVVYKVYSPSGTLYASEQSLEKLGPEEAAVVRMVYYIPENTAAGDYTVDATLMYQNRESKVTSTFMVDEKGVVVVAGEDAPYPLGFGKRISVRNKGNVVAETTVREPLTRFDGYFFQGTPPSYMSDTMFIWEVKNLVPGEQRIIAYHVDYLPFIIFLFSVAAAGWVVLYKLKTVRIRKYIIQKKHIDEGEEFTVGIDVKNSSGAEAREIVVRDFVPSIFEVKDYEGPKPQKKKSEHGTELTWKIGEMFNREERVLTYRIVPVFGINGEVKLPPAMALFRIGTRDIENHSFPTMVGVHVGRHPTLEEAFETEKKRKRKG